MKGIFWQFVLPVSNTPQYWPLQLFIQRPLLACASMKRSSVQFGMQEHVVVLTADCHIAENCGTWK